ncbi:MAG: hypothetical protein KME04_05400 [Pleurocapsa minor GSE-CHR-MK-17-07R]|jgi:hypothetical protein|nr:hypothetical protein [Pleurocapsa minor GSE-CHR-MK 17-07R]
MSSPFSQDWRDCLSAHFRYTVRNHDHATEATVAQILRETGLTDAQIAELKVTAALRVEDLPDGFTPDLDGLAALAEQQAERPPVFAVPDLPSPSQTTETEALELVGDPLEIDFATGEPVDEPPVSTEESLADGDSDEADEEQSPPADAPKQLSFF